MNHPTGLTLRVGDWLVDPRLGQISRSDETVRLDARAMRLLLHLAERAGEVVSIEELLREVWAGVVVTPDSVYQVVASLRRLLHDDPKQPTYIATVPRLGYRMVASVSASEPPAVAAADAPAAEGSNAAPHAQSSNSRRWIPHIAAAFATLAILLFVAMVILPAAKFRNGSIETDTAALPQHSIAVMPFFDLTEEMNHEYFVDGMTEELVERLSKLPGLQVPPARSTFRFKDTGATIGEIASALHVAYVLDGSVRKSGETLRVAARLVRADDGYVVWSQTYDRPVDDMLMIQDDIAAEVAKSLQYKVTPQAAANQD